MARCTAKSKRTGQQCGHGAVEGSDKCKWHGGKSLRGVESPTFKTGQYSKYAIPPHLREAWDAALNDPERLDLTRELALIDVRLGEVVGNLGSGGASALWGQLSEARTKFLAARDLTPTDERQAQKRAADLALWLDRLMVLIAEGAGYAAAWSEACDLIERRRAVVESERKWQEQREQLVPAERVGVFVAAVFRVLEDEVGDRRRVGRIMERVYALGGGGSVQDGRGAAGALAGGRGAKGART